ncbi:MAG: ABC transporter ATP-binding protein [Alphaproteobacteria bacterium]|nr:ABC transporter ATP-binding protein [Alphaproteobacteria bacterium]
MLNVDSLTYMIGGRTILENVSLTLMDGWKVGVVGANGAGKSTLFKLLSGELHADGGEVSVPASQKIGMVRQDIPESDASLIDIVIGADEELSAALHASEHETDAYKIADIHEKLLRLNAYTAEARASVLLTGLGFRDEDLRRPFSSFSGGWRMRVALAAALFVEPDILLLDEPTNHLDLEAIMWLEDYLARYPHTLLIISHDRELLNKCADHIVHVERKGTTLYTGNYDDFERERSLKLGLQQKMFEKQQAKRAHMQAFVDRFRAKASKARQAQSRIKALERMDLVDAVIADRAMKFVFPQPEELAPPVISIDKADVGYAPGKPVLKGVNERIDMDDRIALLGANGNGKSTLVKLVAGKLSAMSGEVKRSGKLRIGYFSQHQTEELDVGSTPFREMAKLFEARDGAFKEAAVRAKLGAFGFSKELADNRIGTLSGGEKARLLFALLSFDAPHLLLLDEPTNHLDIDAREALVQALNAYNGAVLIVSHDPGMLERVAERLWLVKDGEVHPFDGDLEDYRKFILESRRAERRAGKAGKSDSPAPAPKTTGSGVSKNALKKIERMEKDIAKLSAERESLEARMADSALYTQSADQIAATQEQWQTLSDKLAALEEEWLEAQEAAEAS